MSVKNQIIIALLISLLLFLVVNFNVPTFAEADTESIFRIISTTKTPDYQIDLVIDQETGVNYLIIFSELRGHKTIEVLPRLSESKELYIK